MMSDLVMGLAVAGFPLGMAAGYSIRGIYERPPDADDLRKALNRIVNMEEMEEHQRITKFRMARNGRKTQRFDGGPNAQQLRMPLRPTSRRYRRP